MEKVSLNPPKGKRWVSVPHQAPFPTSIGSLIGHVPNKDDWRVHRGHLYGNGVCIVDPSHVDSLAFMGFFGSNLSRRMVSCSGQSRNESPEVNNTKQRVKIQQQLTDGHESVYKHCEAYQSEDTDAMDQPTEIPTDKDLVQFKNVLHLTMVEAFFLSFGLGCLLVTDDDKKILNLEEMWRYFCGQDVLFLYKYVAYHHFRSKGWVVKPGIKFGTTYVLYKEGPPFYHASYSVMVKPVKGELLASIPKSSESPLSWTSLAGLNRITEHVAKELLYCYVIQPTNLIESELQSPTCISKFEVQEILVKRWVSSEERTEIEDKR